MNDKRLGLETYIKSRNSIQNSIKYNFTCKRDFIAVKITS
jgi:hypothetical protein